MLGLFGSTHLFSKIIIIFPHSIQVFCTSFNWFFNEVRGTASLLRSPGPFSVSYLILTVPWSEWFRLFFWSPVRPSFLSRLGELFQGLQLQLVLLSSSYSTMFSALWQGQSISFFHFHLLQNSKWITFPTQSCLILLCQFVSYVYYVINFFIFVTTKKKKKKTPKNYVLLLLLLLLLLIN